MTRLVDADELKKAINTWDKFACLPNGELELFRNLEHPEMFEPYIHLRDVIKAIDNAPTVPLPEFKECYKVFKVGDIIHFNKGILGGDIAKAKIISIEVGILNDNVYVVENCYDGMTQRFSEEFLQEFAEVIKNETGN